MLILPISIKSQLNPTTLTEFEKVNPESAAPRNSGTKRITNKVTPVIPLWQKEQCFSNPESIGLT